MKTIFVVIIVAGLISLGFAYKHKPVNKKNSVQSVTGSYQPVAVLELFTSEGCSSCPPADNLLPQLAKLDSNVISLSFHVDYWNRLGWTDPFSNATYSERQNEYGTRFHLDGVYTPQLVVNGEYELVGSDRGKAENAIKKVLQEKAAIKLSIDEVNTTSNKVQFTVHATGDFTKTDILGALVQKNASTNVKAGENSGARLFHTNVVRSFAKQTAAQKTSFTLEMPGELAGNNWQLIVYTQQKNDLKITGATIYRPANIKL